MVFSGQEPAVFRTTGFRPMVAAGSTGHERPYGPLPARRRGTAQVRYDYSGGVPRRRPELAHRERHAAERKFTGSPVGSRHVIPQEATARRNDVGRVPTFKHFAKRRPRGPSLFNRRTVVHARHDGLDQVRERDCVENRRAVDLPCALAGEAILSWLPRTSLRFPTKRRNTDRARASGQR